MSSSAAPSASFISSSISGRSPKLVREDLGRSQRLDASASQTGPRTPGERSRRRAIASCISSSISARSPNSSAEVLRGVSNERRERRSDRAADVTGRRRTEADERPGVRLHIRP